MHDTIELADGTRFEDSYVLSGGAELWFYVDASKYTMRQVFDAMDDPAKTRLIYNVHDQTRDPAFGGFTKLFSVRLEELSGQINGGLRRAAE